MRIGVDGFNLAMGRGTGISMYARTLTYCLREMGHGIDVIYGMNIPMQTPPDLAETLFFDNLEQENASKAPKPFTANWFAERKGNLLGYQALQVPMSGRVDARAFADRFPTYDRIFNVRSVFRVANRYFNRTGKFLRIVLDTPPDIMHWTYPLPIRLEGAINIYTIHDLVPLRLPYTTLDNKRAHFRLIEAIIRSNATICTVSEASRRDIISYFPAVEPRVFNTYQSLRFGDKEIARLETEGKKRPAALHGLEADGYFLFFGSLEPKKNIGRLIEAMLIACPTRKLVLVGAKAWKTEDELRLLKRAQEIGRVVHLEYLPQAELIELIRGARAVLFPSLSEGFGLPVLEALALATPVLTSREGALPEVAGDAAIFVDAFDAVSIADGITKLDTDSGVCALLRTKGPAQAAKFSRSAYQLKLGAMYDQTLSHTA